MNSTDPLKTTVSPQKNLTDQLRLLAKPLIDPVVTFLARYRLSPDLLTVVGMLAHFLFAYLIGIGAMRWAAVVMALLVPLDAFDGALARKLGRKQGGFGAFLDSTLDRLAEIILFGGFIFYYMQLDNPQMLAVAYIAITGSLMVSYARARAESLGFDSKVGIASRVERYIVLIIFLFLNIPQVALILLAVATYITLFQRMYSVWQQAVDADEAGD